MGILDEVNVPLRREKGRAITQVSVTPSRPVDPSTEPVESAAVYPADPQLRVIEAASHRERYVLACAAVTASSHLLVSAHAAVGAPTGPARDDGEQLLRAAVAQARTAAGAMAVVGGRLMTRVREDEARLLPHLPTPASPEPGVTAPGWSEQRDRMFTERAVRAAAAECAAADIAIRRCRIAPRELVDAALRLSEIAQRVLAACVH